MINTRREDVETIRSLAQVISEIANLPIQEEKRALWRRLNAIDPVRPMVMVDQVCWNEIDVPELTLVCRDAECRGYERELRRILYQWDHFPVDMVVEPFIRVPKAITGMEIGPEIQEEIASTDPENDVQSHRYRNQFQTEEDLEKIKIPAVSHDEIETKRRVNLARELFDGLLEVRPWGVDPRLSLWDPISQWMGVEPALYALVDRPDYVHRLLERMTTAYLGLLDQLQDRKLLCGEQSLIHCTGAYTDELPAPGYNPEKPRTKDLWMFGLAQMFSSVSPGMFDEFEVEYASRICRRFGLVYYGCCDPLDGKMNEVRRIPGVRKVSMSPWTDQERGAAEIGADYVFSRKPNPALLATEIFDLAEVRRDLEITRNVINHHGCALEIILKDISTVRYEPERLDQWARIAMEVAAVG